LIGFALPELNSPFEIGIEDAAQGSLRSLFDRRASGYSLDCLNDTSISIIICGIIRGRIVMHNHDILHRDLRSEHIFVDVDGRPKIGGFGSIRDFSSELCLTMGVGSAFYKAHEMFEDGNDSNAECTPAVDVYSFGLILYELIVGKPVFPGCIPLGQLQAFIMQGKRPEIPGNVSLNMTRIIRQCWTVDPDIRESFSVIWQQHQILTFKVVPNAEGC
jgi:serine/threonine protein kinase